MKYEDLVKMSVKELKDRLKDLNTQAQAAAGKDLDALLEEATTITGILDDGVSSLLPLDHTQIYSPSAPPPYSSVENLSEFLPGCIHPLHALLLHRVPSLSCIFLLFPHIVHIPSISGTVPSILYCNPH